MARNIRTARGEVIDFDAIVIKQQIAAAPMNIDVARRKEFIDSKEGKVRGARRPSTFIDGAGTGGAPNPNQFVTGAETRQVVVNDAVSVKQEASVPTDFEIEGDTASVKKGPVEAIPVMPERKK